MNRLGILLLLAALLAGCATEGQGRPTDTPTPFPAAPTMPAPTKAAPTEAAPTAAPTMPAVTLPPPTAAPAPTPTVMSIEQADIQCEEAAPTADIPKEIGEVINELGFALEPSALPAGFRLAGVSSSNNEVRQIYQNVDKNIIVAYPVDFSPDSASDPLGWERPQDAVSGIRVGDQTAHLMIGGWSDASVIAGPALKPDRAVWDYDKSLALFFTCRVASGLSVAVAIQASQTSSEPITWIDAGKIVNMAQSMRRILGPR